MDLSRVVSSTQSAAKTSEDLLRQQLFQPPSASQVSSTEPALSAEAVQAAFEAEQNEADTKLTDEEQKALQEAIEKLDTLVKPLSIGLNVQRIESLNRMYVQLFDRETGETLREIPPRKILQMQENIRAFQGLFFDKFS